MTASGGIDGVRAGRLVGWYDAAQGSGAVRIGTAFFDFVHPAWPRPDAASDAVREPTGFEFSIPDSLLGGTHTVELLVVGPNRTQSAAWRTLDLPGRDAAGKPSTRAAVVCWDLAHNPAGRALVLYDILTHLYDHVDLIGPMSPRFGGELWPPLQGRPGLNVIAHKVADFQELDGLARQAARTRYDFVWVCKPRFPGLYVAMHLRNASDCPIALDIDDYELSFFRNRDKAPLPSNTLGALQANRVHLADLAATVLGHSVIDRFDLRTVSNVTLQRAFGGELVPHARDPDEFDPARFDRAALRERLGVPADAKLVAFIGTIREHKGILRVCEALSRLDRDDVWLLVGGRYAPADLKDRVAAAYPGRTVVLDEIPFSELAGHLAASDAIYLPQDPSSETAYYQLPAKIADGLALGLQVVLPRLPPFADLCGLPGITLLDPEDDVATALSEVLDHAVTARDEARETFQRRFSTRALAERLAPRIGPGAARPGIADWEATYERITGHGPSVALPALVRADTRRQRDLVVLWKQQDSGLFGRRVDMIARTLLDMDRADRVIVLDAPMSLGAVRELEARAQEPRYSNARLVYSSFVAKFLGRADDGALKRRSFVYGRPSTSFQGRYLPSLEDMHEEFQRCFAELGLSENAVLWICPVAMHLPSVLRAAPFKRHVVDLIDDEREFRTTPQAREIAQRNYAHALSVADDVITNTATLAERFGGFTQRPIRVVPNAVEPVRIAPEDVLRPAGIPPGRTILGYLGNLRDRVDAALIEAVADAGPDWHVVLVGPTGGNREIERLDRHERVTLTGVLDYETSRRVAAGFDVGLIPHVVNALTASMDPLKLYLYRELGLPVASTPVSNLGVRDDRVVIAHDTSAGAFIEAVRRAQAMGPGRTRGRLPFGKQRAAHWSDRVHAIGELFP